MNRKAMYDLTYGLFLLSARAGDRRNACITNTCIQVANSPTRVAISCINANYTCDLIKEGGVFTLSLLDESAKFDLFRHFGFQSGRDADKFADVYVKEDGNGVPYLPWCSCAYLSCKVVSATDLGSHTLFIAEVLDGDVLSDLPPMTYAYYQANVKPKAAPKPESAKKRWQCKVCGYVYEGEALPEDFVCPICKHGPEDFEPI